MIGKDPVPTEEPAHPLRAEPEDEKTADHCGRHEQFLQRSRPAPNERRTSKDLRENDDRQADALACSAPQPDPLSRDNRSAPLCMSSAICRTLAAVVSLVTITCTSRMWACSAAIRQSMGPPGGGDETPTLDVVSAATSIWGMLYTVCSRRRRKSSSGIS
jgi:hypothetical protein